MASLHEVIISILLNLLKEIFLVCMFIPGNSAKENIDYFEDFILYVLGKTVIR